MPGLDVLRVHARRGIGRIGAPGGLQGWQVSPFEVHAGRWGRSEAGGGAWLSPSRAQEGWPVEAWNLDEALAEPPEREFVAEVTLTRAGS